MATTDSGQANSSPQGAADWNKTNPQGARDRQPAGQGGGGIAQLVRDTTYQRLGTQKDRATDTLGSVAGAVRSVTDQLRDSQPAIADYATRAADGIERWASQLRNQDIESTMRNVRQFARREPALFVGIAFGVGLLAARLLKSSSNDLHSDGGDRFSPGRGTDWDNPTSGAFGTPSSGSYGSGSSTSTGGLYGGGTSSSGLGSTAGASTTTEGGAASSGRDIPGVSSDVRPTGGVL